MASFFLRAAVGDFELDEPSQLIRLLVGMARNRLAERVRFHQRHRRDVRRVGGDAPEETLIPSPSESPSEVVSRGELLTMFRARMSSEEQKLAELRSHGHDWESVAREIGGTAEGRRKQLARAIARIGTELGLDPVAG
jgi:RNA polymerase sigma-70 factor (ECF subfamily)